jgi:heme exporter protein B
MRRGGQPETRELSVYKFWWIVHKDLVAEYRSLRVWPTMLLLGIVVALVFSLQLELLPDQKRTMLGGLLWLAIFFAGMTAIERSFAAEREDDCWDGLRLFPVPWSQIYWSKLIANTVALGALECLLVPLFFGLSGAPLGSHLPELALVAILANAGLAAVGTLVSALATSLGRSGNLLVVLVLPLAIPVILAAAEATRLIAESHIDAAWWRWVQFLGAFAVVFVIVGTLLFPAAVED